ncbi:putative bifunctional diguanylate cyclase/phosphodiesterase [Chitinilyticum piscinae]|uniref:EAL domain-containing protein n=1 Tax=Chitinilyticum piscinae TaxID=2866724 RepID=A0A8J7KDN6_9NEIS|nr:EAL domain-containing protein [Chitinilyticum piscinae]MBE9608859.1 EAL domain-containing protein [Chitinilyticum piscinae]
MIAAVQNRLRCAGTFGILLVVLVALHWLDGLIGPLSSFGALLAAAAAAQTSRRVLCSVLTGVALLAFFLARLSPLQALPLAALYQLTALWLVRSLPQGFQIFHLADVRRLLLRGVLAGSLLLAFADTLVVRLPEQSIFEALPGALNDALLASLSLLVLLPSLHSYAGRRWRLSSVGELLLLSALSALVCVLVARGGESMQPLLFLLFPLMIWATQHRHYPGFLVVSFAACSVVLLSRAYYQPVPDEWALLGDLVFLNALTATGLLLAASGSDERGMARELKAEKQKLARLLDHVPTYIFIEDLSGRFTYANRAFAGLLGLEVDVLVGTPVAGVQAMLSGAEPMPDWSLSAFEWRLHGARGEHVLLGSRFPLIDSQGDVYAFGFAATDISEQLLADEQARLTAKVFDNASEGILITDGSGIIIAVNAAFTQITGHQAGDAIGRRSRMFAPGESDTAELQQILRDGGHWQGEMRDRHRSGHHYPAWLSISAVTGSDGRVTHCVGVFSDITARKESEQRLQYLATHDPLTGLYNRAGLQEQLQRRIAGCDRSREALALLFIDLDRFKAVNDSFGHALGDSLLQQVAMRLQASLQEHDLVARLGGDEFTVLLDDFPSHAALSTIADLLVSEMGRPYRIEGHELYLTSSIGVSLYPQDADDAQGLLRTADIAMYRAKELGKNTFQFYASELNNRVSERLKLDSEMRQALRDRQFQLYYQPKYDLATRTLTGVEALLRWDSPRRGKVSPVEFIPAAEESGLIVVLGEWILRTACAQMRQWRDQGVAIPHVAVNLSARQFVPYKLVDTVRQALQDACIPPACLELEITESMIMANPDEAVLILRELRAMGVKVSIDDFGTGYSSLSNLRNFPLDALKIDRSFITNLPHDDDNAAITAAIVAMARKLRLTVVAEGVESHEQADYLNNLGCQVAQGFLFSPALSPATLPSFLQRPAATELAAAC